MSKELLIQKTGQSVVNTYTQWGIVCSKADFKPGGKIKSLPERSWYDEHGKDVYIPVKTMLDGGEVEFEMAYKGQELSSNPFNLSLAFDAISNFKKWLTGNNTDNGSGAEMNIYSPFTGRGYSGCYVTEISNEDPVVMLKTERGNLYNENVVTFNVKFYVTDPATSIVLSEAG